MENGKINDTMSKEKTADLLDNLIGMVDDTQGNNYDDALRRCIKALKTDADLISRKAAIDEIREYKVNPNISDDELEIKGFNDGLELAISSLAVLPSAERHGKWIFGATMGHSWMKCSECCKSQSGQTACFTYCPNCGARMDGE